MDLGVEREWSGVGWGVEERKERREVQQWKVSIRTI